jgi:Holliday junction resolvase-like predicted endonuclease
MVSERVSAEVRTNKGRIDMVVELTNEIWIMEFKINQNADSALSQIREKKYYEKYLSSNKVIKLIGVSFSTTERNITAFKVEDYK